MAVTPIYEYSAKDSAILAGTLTMFKGDDDSDFLPWQGIRELGDIGSTGSFIEQTTLEDKTKRYLGGMKDTQEAEMSFAWYADDANHKKLRDYAIAGKSVDIKVQFPNGVVAAFHAALSGFAFSSGGNEDVITAKVSLRMSGDPTWTDPA